MNRPWELVSHAIGLLHAAGFMLKEAGANEAAAAVNRALGAATFARAAVLRRDPDPAGGKKGRGSGRVGQRRARRP
jgi:hypothetical protein